MRDTTTQDAVASAFVFVAAVSSYLNVRLQVYRVCKYNHAPSSKTLDIGFFH
jgi:hypothetical protein